MAKIKASIIAYPVIFFQSLGTTLKQKAQKKKQYKINCFPVQSNTE